MTPTHHPTPALNVLVVGATGSIGRLVLAEALRRGHKVRALVRATSHRRLPDGVQAVVGDLTRADTLHEAVAGVDAIVFTHGTAHADKAAAESVDYGAVRNVLAALDGRTKPRIALMSTIGVTNRTCNYNRSAESHDWKRRGERLLRASGLPCTIVRPGWFDLQAPDQQRLVFLQGDRRWAGDPSDGVVARRQIAEVLVASLTSDAARNKSFELVAERGPAPRELDPLFQALDLDAAGALDAVHDTSNMPLSLEPERVRADLGRIAATA